MKRRDFGKYTALVSASMLVPQFLKGINSRKIEKEVASNGKILVVIQLSGGNDGLNTVIPFRNDTYYQLRPGIGIYRDQLLEIEENAGLNGSMRGLADLYVNGHVAIINNVGYPNPNRSHFRSMDIWHTASDFNEYLNNGWLGRFLDSSCNAKINMPYHTIEVDDTLSLAMKGEKLKGIAVQDINKMYRATNRQELKDLATTFRPTGNENLEYMYKTMSETMASAEYIHEQSRL